MTSGSGKTTKDDLIMRVKYKYITNGGQQARH
jgi:hypothetical protein